MQHSCSNSIGLENWLRIIRAPKIGPKTFGKLLEHFGDVESILNLSVNELSDIPGIGVGSAEKMHRSFHSFDPRGELQVAADNNVWMIHINDPRYPKQLKYIPDPPPILYIRGTLSPLDDLSVAIVGSRKCSFYGSEQSEMFGSALAHAGLSVVSGMAMGVDAMAHHGALKAGGRTLAVHGTGLKYIYPPQNAGLASKIIQHGACISELPVDTQARAEQFPARNRIIAGLSLATIVIEAANRSGALITARLAGEFGRDVLSVPGKIDSPLSGGSNKLIKQGAHLIDCIEDVIEIIKPSIMHLKSELNEVDCGVVEIEEEPKVALNLSENEKLIVGLVSGEALHVDSIIHDSKINAGSVNALLMSLRLKGVIKQLPGNHWLKC